MDMSSNRSKGVRSEINVTPLIDVLLVLLIIFMVIQPAAVRGLDALVPQHPNTQDMAARPHADDAIVVQIVADGGRGAAYKINEVSFAKEAIAPKLREIFASRQDKAMFLKGDAALDFAVVAEVIDAGHLAGVEQIGILTSQSGTSR